jgi:predicted  nucleic acid-binding Zn-ribbon protein
MSFSPVDLNKEIEELLKKNDNLGNEIDDLSVKLKKAEERIESYQGWYSDEITKNYKLRTKCESLEEILMKVIKGENNG